MAFYIVEGLPGGGKSYYAAELALKAMKEGAIVHTNLPIYDGTVERDGEFPNEIKARGFEALFKRIPGNPRCWVTKEQIGTDEAGDPDFRYSSAYLVGGREGAENVVICDEAALKMRTRSQAKDAEKNEPIEDLVRLARHAGLEVYFLTQDNSQVVAKLRPMADFRILCQNISKLPLIGGVASKLFGTFRRIYFQRQEKTPYQKYYSRFSQEVATFYRTDAMATVLNVRGETTRKKGSSDLGKALAWKYGLGLVACLLLLGFGMYKLKTTVSTITGGAEKKEVPAEKKTMRIDTAGNVTTKTEKELVRPPAGMVGIEWLEYDEHILGSVRWAQNAVTVYTRGARKLFVGGFYEGQKIVTAFTHAAWWYFVTETNRVVVVRPYHAQDRASFPALTIPGKDNVSRELGGLNPISEIKNLMPSL